MKGLARDGYKRQAGWLSNCRCVDENNPEQRNLKINYDSVKGNVMLSTTAQSDPVLVNDGQDVVMHLSDSIKLEAIPMENRVSVSYTHLDVYKRQPIII